MSNRVADTEHALVSPEASWWHCSWRSRANIFGLRYQYLRRVGYTEPITISMRGGAPPRYAAGDAVAISDKLGRRPSTRSG